MQGLQFLTSQVPFKINNKRAISSFSFHISENLSRAVYHHTVLAKLYFKQCFVLYWRNALIISYRWSSASSSVSFMVLAKLCMEHCINLEQYIIALWQNSAWSIVSFCNWRNSVLSMHCVIWYGRNSVWSILSFWKWQNSVWRMHFVHLVLAEFCLNIWWAVYHFVLAKFCLTIWWAVYHFVYPKFCLNIWWAMYHFELAEFCLNIWWAVYHFI